MCTFRPFKTFEMCTRFTNQLIINVFKNCHAPTVPKLHGKLSPKVRMRNSDRSNIPGGWHVWPLYWNVARESAANSWKFGSLSPPLLVSTYRYLSVPSVPSITCQSPSVPVTAATTLTTCQCPPLSGPMRLSRPSAFNAAICFSTALGVMPIRSARTIAVRVLS